MIGGTKTTISAGAFGSGLDGSKMRVNCCSFYTPQHKIQTPACQILCMLKAMCFSEKGLLVGSFLPFSLSLNI